MDGQQNIFDMGNLQTIGIANSLKTGYMILDMMVAMSLPFLLRYFLTWIESMYVCFILQPWRAWWTPRHQNYQRLIVYKSIDNYWGESTSLDNDSQNSVLIKAIQLYLHHKINLELNIANLDLTSMEDNNFCEFGGYYNDYNYDDEDSGENTKTLFGMLSKYKIIKKPLHDIWHQIGHHGDSNAIVELKLEEHQLSNRGKGKVIKTQKQFELHFASPAPDAIDAFIDKAYDWYMSEIRLLEDNSRYLFELQTSKPAAVNSESGEPCSGIVYARYRLSEDKTFSSLFFQQKQKLIQLVDHFQRKTGKYSISGFPQKLGLLLHGPPGTGKTSLIKALAQYTGRSIVNVPLSKIKTNSQLMSIFFDKRYPIQGESVAVNLTMKDVIFVMEDIDAAADVVKRRDGKTGADLAEKEYVDIPVLKTLWQLMLESNSNDCRELVRKLMGKSKKLKEEAIKPEIMLSMLRRMLALPGLGLVGADVEALVMIGEDAVNSADNLLNQFDTVDRFLGIHAESINEIIDAGGKVDEELVNLLLGERTESSMFSRSRLAQKISSTNSKTSDALISNTKSCSNEGLVTNMKDVIKRNGGIGASFRFPMHDKLNLSGLLNVLDGVVDTPGRIVIMTSNHPEHLDPALIRPGRIDKKLMLGYMQSEDIIQMLEHYFQITLTAGEKLRITNAVDGNNLERNRQLNLTPAQIEQYSVEYEDIEEMILLLEEKAYGKPSIFK
jgi:mitochondrial chaperone BCS1